MPDRIDWSTKISLATVPSQEFSACLESPFCDIVSVLHPGGPGEEGDVRHGHHEVGGGRFGGGRLGGGRLGGGRLEEGRLGGQQLESLDQVVAHLTTISVKLHVGFPPRFPGKETDSLVKHWTVLTNSTFKLSCLIADI
jgi:hypothetical protein